MDFLCLDAENLPHSSLENVENRLRSLAVPHKEGAEGYPAPHEERAGLMKFFVTARVQKYPTPFDLLEHVKSFKGKLKGYLLHLFLIQHCY